MSIRREKIYFFENHLLDFFKKAGREHLPWRKKKMTAYEVWVSEIMLQQTQVSRVIGYYAKFLRRFPDIGSLSKASWKEFLPYYEGLGYYNRGRNMLKAAQMVVEECNGRFPRDRKLLETIPGIGPYTAAAIMSFAYGDDHLAWDTNLKRVIGRFFYGTKNFLSHPERSEACLPAGRDPGLSKKKRDSSAALGMTSSSEAFWEDKFETPKKDMNAALMDFGSALCMARPKCGACPLRSRCMYYREKGRKEMRDKGCKIMDKKEGKVDWKEAQAYVFLHENHKKYFSSLKASFKPFVLPSGYNTRAGIKKYFHEKYGLTLAVRPPHTKKTIGGKPALLVNAQTLLGKPAFTVFPKKSAEEYNKLERYKL